MKFATVVALSLTLFAANAMAISYNVSIDPGQEVPAPNVSGFTPSGSATVNVNTITGAFSISGSYAGMTSNVSNSHLHGLAPPGTSAGPIFGLTNSGGTSGTISGSSTLSASNLTGLLNGNTYINIHTANNVPGEIRGQVTDSDIRVFNVVLDPIQEVPVPNVAGFSPSGSARVVVDTSTGQIEISGSYTGMTSNVGSSHLHGLAPSGTATGVIFPLTSSGGTSGTFSGSDILSPANLFGFLSGQTYINIHTANNGLGEIRGQIVPEPSTFVLVLLAGMVCFYRQSISKKSIMQAS